MRAALQSHRHKGWMKLYRNSISFCAAKFSRSTINNIDVLAQFLFYNKSFAALYVSRLTSFIVMSQTKALLFNSMDGFAVRFVLQVGRVDGPVLHRRKHNTTLRSYKRRCREGHGMTRHNTKYVLYCMVSCHVMSCHAMPCHAMPCHLSFIHLL